MSIETEFGQIPQDDRDDNGEAAAELDAARKAMESGKDSTPTTTDVHNAARLVKAFGAELRWCKPYGWLAWDGRRWARDEMATALSMAMKLGDIVLKESIEAVANGDSQRAERLIKWTMESRKHPRVLAALDFARPALAVRVSDFDADPWLLNCRNGTLELTTGTLREHRRDDLITMVAGTFFEPEATCPRWMQFLGRIFGGDPLLSQYVARIAGMALTGDVSVQEFFIFHGEGANGKSTLTDLLIAMMGDYACRAPNTLLIVDEKHSSHPTEIAGLAGKRLVVASENDKDARLKIQLVKQMTGDSTLSARFMNHDFFDFTRQFKLVLQTNHKPRVMESGEAAWRRLRLIPFNVVIPEAERDEGLLLSLRKELSGILSWAVAGCVVWKSIGMKPPDPVINATREYRRTQDKIGDFLDACCTIGERESVMSGELYSAYKSWCENNGEREVTQNAFAQILIEKRLYTERKTGGEGKGRKWWRGIGLQSNLM